MAPFAGKYELLHRLGQGGMAEVFLARQSGPDGFEKLVVIKRILPQFAEDEGFSTMFRDEARTAADLRHPNVVQIYETGTDQGTLYIAMEFLHGQNVRTFHRRAARLKTTLPVPHVLQIVLDTAAGLYYAHTKKDLRGSPLGIVHRDVSPQNVIVTYEGATKLVDFGIAKAKKKDADTATGVVKGKFTYMSPEQAAGESIDARADQFALGIMLWELLTMRRLFKRENELKTLAAIAACDVRPPSALVAVSPKLDAIVLKSLARTPAARFANCQDFASALEDFLAAEGQPHSPARLGAYARTLFEDVLREEEEKGLVAGWEVPKEPRPEPVPQRRGKRASATVVSRRKENGSQPDEASGPPAIPVSTHTGADPAVKARIKAEKAKAKAEAKAARQAEKLAKKARRPPMDPARRRRFLLRLVQGAAAVTVLAVGGLASTAWLNKPRPVDLVVRSEPPGAQVWVDGAIFGNDTETPCVLRGLLPGRVYVLRLELAGFEPLERPWTAPDGERRDTLELVLRSKGRDGGTGNPGVEANGTGGSP